ncbi:MAG: 16S rRNA (guanine(966)-N(2))-methyltransferase RsmD [Clostridiales bacterium]|nr:16S rRNA (guanine(966)-N(2))-methyltransferase RsmD [Clostridiales bacterium]
MHRIVSGKYKGTRLNAPKGDKTRPTSDKVKEALFSIIQMRIPRARFLDLFAGSGQIGLEALSRGAGESVMVEHSRGAGAVIRSNIEKLHAEQETEIICADVFRALRILGEAGRKFDIIYMDPPYAEAASYFPKIASVVSGFDLLSEGGMLIIEHSVNTEFDKNVINLTLSRRCKYGMTLLTFYNR